MGSPVLQMENPSDEASKLQRGMRDILRCYWCRIASAIRSLFAVAKGGDEGNKEAGVSLSSSAIEPTTCPHEDNIIPFDVADALGSNGVFLRKWEEMTDIDENLKSCKFRVASYNVLCQDTFESMSHLYEHLEINSTFREWTHRWALLHKEITELDADILGLQEINEKSFRECFLPLLESLEYTVVFDYKVHDEINHGLVIAVKKEKFTIDSSETIEFFQHEDSVLDRGNIGQIARLTCRSTGLTLLVANTHLIFNPYRGDTKFAQIALLVSRIHQCRRNDEPIICIGDFNIEHGSSIYEYITTGRMDASSFALHLGSGQLKLCSPLCDPTEILFDLPLTTFVHTMMDRSGVIQSDLFELLYSLGTTLSHIFTHRLNLSSVHELSEKPKVSTHHADSGNPDFIFYDAGNPATSSLMLIRRLCLPSREDLAGVDKWPNKFVPSDHICLLAEFAITRS